MTERLTPFALVFAEIGPDRFPAIARALDERRLSSADRDAFVLLEPVAHLLRELAPDEVSPEELEAHLVLLHHAFRHWEAGGWVVRVSRDALRRAVAGPAVSSQPPCPALYLQVPAGRVWRSRDDASAPEPLDGVFVSAGPAAGAISVLGVFGLHRGRPGFSAVALEGRVGAGERADELDLAAAARRPDGSPAFAPLLTGGAGTDLYSLANPGELLLLTCRLLALEEMRNADCGMRNRGTGLPPGRERIVVV